MDQKRIDELKRRITADPENLVDRFVLLSEYHAGAAWEEAIGEGKEILKRQPDYIAVHVLLGEALLRAGRKEEARELLGTARELAEKFGHRAPKEGVARLLAELDGPG